jgi:glycosyltransferase involved in cell wall biosynthesis
MNLDENRDLIQRICIVVPTYNRADILEKSLAMYSEILYISEATILIIDNNSTDRTNEVVREFKKKYQLKVEYYFESQQGLSIAKNTAIRICKQDYMLFLDDDCYPQRDILVNCLNSLILPNTFVLGKVKRWKEMVPAWIEDDFFIRNPESDTRTMLIDTNQVKGCILLIERNVFEIINNFNTSMGMNGTKIAYGEDTELGYRAKSFGIEIWYDPSIAMYHRSHFVTVRAFLKKHYIAGQAYQSLRVKKKGVFRLLALVCYHLFKSPFIFLSFITKSANWKGAFVASLSKVSNYSGQLMFQLKSTVQSLTTHSAL